jgi:glutamate dehydrogenase
MQGHRLRREIVATVLCNEIVNMTGPTFPDRLRAAAGCDTTALVIAFEAARRVFRLDELHILNGRFAPRQRKRLRNIRLQ